VRRLLLLLLVVLVNLPAAHEKWTDHEVAAKGQDVVATVVHARSRGGSNLVDYLLPRDLDPKQTTFSVALNRDAYDRAVATRHLEVRAVPGKPGANRPEGESSNPLFLVVAISADVILLLVAVLARVRRRRTPEEPEEV
jgi:hypothetical protein